MHITRTSLARLAALFIACGLAALRPSPALAWGAEGHRVVAMIAGQLLTPTARARVSAILALEPGASLPSISMWADETRDRSTATWHYVNLPRDSDCVYVAARDCPTGRCVVSTLSRQVQRLATSSGADQLEALKYVVHFTADVHQPLHAGFADDKGGNTYQLQAFGRGTNLHALWDTALLRDINPSAPSLARSLGGRTAPAAASLVFDPAQWAAESCRIASRPDFYPGRYVGQDYLSVFEPIAQERVRLAGLRLAALLNQLLGGAQTATSQRNRSDG